MENTQKILVAVDFSSYSKITLKHAAETARLSQAQLFIVNVINQRDVRAMESALDKIKSMQDFKANSVEDWIKGLKEERLAEMERLKASVDLTGIDYSFEFKVGFPVEEILELVDIKKIDLVIIGSKGRSDLENFFVGSVASKLSRRCPVPLTIVPKPK